MKCKFDDVCTCTNDMSFYYMKICPLLDFQQQCKFSRVEAKKIDFTGKCGGCKWSEPFNHPTNGKIRSYMYCSCPDVKDGATIYARVHTRSQKGCKYYCGKESND